jgi:hypothetical protein
MRRNFEILTGPGTHDHLGSASTRLGGGTAAPDFDYREVSPEPQRTCGPYLIAAGVDADHAQGTQQRPSFVAGWVLGLVVVGGLVLIIAKTANVASSGPSTAVYAIKLTLGVLLLLLAVRQWRTAPGPASRPQRRSG